MQPFITARQAEIVELCRTHHVRRLSVFGSAVRDDFDPSTSDVDIRIEFEEPYRSAAFDSYASLREELERLLGRRVDLLSSKTIPNRYLRREIEETQVTLYAA